MSKTIQPFAKSVDKALRGPRDTYSISGQPNLQLHTNGGPEHDGDGNGS